MKQMNMLRDNKVCFVLTILLTFDSNYIYRLRSLDQEKKEMTKLRFLKLQKIKP